MYKGTFYICYVSNFRNFGVASKRGRMMEDLISRQTIISGLEFVIEHGIETDGAHSISAEAMLEFVRELPTVQPEITHEQAIDYLHSTGWMQEHDRQMMLDGVHRVIAQPEPHWIPVTERLPKEKDAGILKKLGTSKRSEYVLATVEVKGERMTVTACTYDGKWDWNMKYAFPDYKIIAWMPLPEPYKGVTE